MPKINMQEYEQATPNTGEFARMGAGAYVLVIQAVRTSGKDSAGRYIDFVNAREYVKLIYDVAEGDFAGHFSDDYWSGEDKDYGHQLFMSWKNMGAFKNFIQCLETSNPGFDAMAAFEADNWAMFIGKKIGAVFGEEEYRANDGSVKTRLAFPTIKSVQDVRNGKYRIPKLKELKEDKQGGYYANSTPSGGGELYDDIPFS